MEIDAQINVHIFVGRQHTSIYLQTNAPRTPIQSISFRLEIGASLFAAGIRFKKKKTLRAAATYRRAYRHQFRPKRNRSEVYNISLDSKRLFK